MNTQRKAIILATCLAVMVVAVFALHRPAANASGVYAIGPTASSYSSVAHINGEPVFQHEYFVFFREQVAFFEDTGGADVWELSFGNTPAEVQAKMNALRQLSLVRTVASVARAEGIELPPESEEVARAAALAYLADIPQSLAQSTGSDLATILPVMRDRQMLSHMHERYTANFSVSQADFEAFFESYVLSRTNYLRIVATVAQLPHSQGMPSGEAAEYVAALLSQAYDDALPPGLTIFHTEDLAQGPYPASLALAVRHTEEGGVVIVPESTGYYVVRVDARRIPELETLTNSALEEYTKMHRDEIFHQLYLSWRGSEPIISLNEDVFTAISIADLGPRS